MSEDKAGPILGWSNRTDHRLVRGECPHCGTETEGTSRIVFSRAGEHRQCGACGMLWSRTLEGPPKLAWLVIDVPAARDTRKAPWRCPECGWQRCQATSPHPAPHPSGGECYAVVCYGCAHHETVWVDSE